jgi:protease IV
MIAAVVLTALLGLSLLMNLQQVLKSLPFETSKRRLHHQDLQEILVEDNSSRNKIAVVDLEGIITSDSWDRSGHTLTDSIQAQLDLAGEDKNVRAVVLKIDSPGGEVLASDEISQAIRGFQDDYDKPVVTSMGSVAASGGYYVAAPSQWIVANELTLTGSIGVIMHSYNYRGLMNKVGVRPEIFKSGKFKDMLSGEKSEEEVLPEERKMIQDLINETFVRFKEVVRTGRAWAHNQNGDQGRKLVENWEDYADGRVLSGKQAYDHGFVDELGNFDTAVDSAKRLAGVKTANLIQYQRPFDLGNLFRLFGEAQSRTFKLDLGVELPRLRVGRLYFLSPTVLQ